MDIPTSIALGSAAILSSREALTRLLGPTADYLGGELRNTVEKCNVNLDNVFRIALCKLGGSVEKPGVVSPRVLKHVIEEAVFCEDELVAEYLGGVLASARSENGRDDRGVCFLTDIKSLSVYQLRTHCLIYSAIARMKPRIKFNPRNFYGNEHRTITVVISDDDYWNAMNYCAGENHEDIAKHSFLGLQTRGLSKEGLIAFEGEITPECTRPWRFFWPTQYGHELFAWGLGLGQQRLASYFDVLPDQIPSSIPAIEVLEFNIGETHYGATVRQY